MAKTKKWTLLDLKKAVKESGSIRQVIKRLGLVPAGGNYIQIKRNIEVHNLDTSNFTGRLWNKGLKTGPKPKTSLQKILVKNSTFQSYKLKRRLFAEKLKKEACEKCGWAQRSEDGRLPLELDHINGDRFDNRIINLQILCPNCHSLQSTHRGRNITHKAGVVKW